jgi:hypothetical protein
MGQQIKSVAQGSVERNLGEHGDRLITLLASRAPRLYCSLKASTALQRAVADTRWDSPGALRNAVACAVAHGAGCRGRCIFAVPACSADAGAVPTSAAFACNTRTASSRRCMAADTRGPWTGKKVMVVDVGVNTVVDESKRMDDVRLAWQIRFWLGAVMVLAHRLFWPTADTWSSRAAVPAVWPWCFASWRSGCAPCAWGVHFGVHFGVPSFLAHLPLVLVSLLQLVSHHVCISTPALPVTASTVSRRAHLRGQYACILPPLQQLLIAARLGCQPRRPHRARRVSISTRRASVADNSKLHYLLLLPST